jgi:hypothetical protein
VAAITTVVEPIFDGADAAHEGDEVSFLKSLGAPRELVVGSGLCALTRNVAAAFPESEKCLILKTHDGNRRRGEAAAGVEGDP